MSFPKEHSHQEHVEMLGIDTSSNTTCIVWGTYSPCCHKWILKNERSILDAAYMRNEYFVPAIESIRKSVKMSYHSLDAICCVIGPGSFTGLRTGLSFAKGIMAVYNTAIVGISSHDLWAYMYRDSNDTILIAHESRRNRAYTSICAHKRDMSYCDYDVRTLTRQEIKESTFEEIGAMVQHSSQQFRCVGTAAKNLHVYFDTYHSTLVGDNIIFEHNSHPQIGESLLTLGYAYFKNNMSLLDVLAEPLYIKAEV